MNHLIANMNTYVTIIICVVFVVNVLLPIYVIWCIHSINKRLKKLNSSVDLFYSYYKYKNKD